jgi:hypothetical protein
MLLGLDWGDVPGPVGGCTTLLAFLSIVVVAVMTLVVRFWHVGLSWLSLSLSFVGFLVVIVVVFVLVMVVVTNITQT